MSKVSLITIGGELLKGRIVNTNAADIGKILREAGFHLHRVVSVEDDMEAIRSTLEYEVEQSDIVLTSGGLGPTQDDITKHALAKWYGQEEFFLDKPSLQRLEDIAAKYKRELTEPNKEMARIPLGSQALANNVGAAPGILLKKNDKWVAAMPGVPFEMRAMLKNVLLPLLRVSFSPSEYKQFILRLGSFPESDAAERMLSLLPEIPKNLSIAYLPRMDGLWLELHGEDISESVFQYWIKEVSALFTQETFATGIQAVAEILQEICLEKQLSLSVAESLTGGHVAGAIVDISGASNYFRGSITAYATELKSEFLGVAPQLIEEQGVVSSAVAEAMAQNVRLRLQSDIGLATTGIAETTRDARAHAWIAYADEDSVHSVKINLHYDRKVNIQRLVQKVLVFCIQILKSRFA